MTMPGIIAVLLDVDGTLLNSNDEHAHSWLTALQEQSFNPEYAQVRSRIGMGGDKMTFELCGLQPDDPRARSMAKRASDVFRTSYLSQVQPTRGARALLERLKANGHDLIVATSAGGDLLELLLDRAGVLDLIDHSATSSDVSRSKPDADLVHAALGKAGLTADEAVMVGDTPYDIESASKAGVKTIALRCGGWWDDAALSGAVAIYDDPEAMLTTLGHLLPTAVPGDV
jgi:HAD superfamily hydrolase (TIGR01509 family)